MKPSSSILFLLVSTLVFLTSCANPNDTVHEAFLQCLTNKSLPSYPISGLIYTPDNSSFPTVLQTYIRNLRFNNSWTLKPFLIITATHESHIQSSILCAKNYGLLMKIRSGGHDYEGISYWAETPFFILDMFNIRAITVNITDESAWVQTGATLGEVYYRIAEKSSTHGYPAGVCPTVGVGGHLSGGGYGNLMRKYGLTADNILDAQIIDVNGQILDRTAMGEGLFWAIRGGGGASFGVVLSYKIKLVVVPEIVTVFKITRTNEQGLLDIVYSYLQVANKLDDNLFIRLTLDVINGTNRGTFRCLYLGGADSLLSVVNKSFPELGPNRTDLIEMSWVNSTLFWTDFALGTPVVELLDRKPQVLTHLKRKSDYLKHPIPKAGLKYIFEKMIQLQTPQLTFNPYGGRMAEIPSPAIPFPHRAGNLAKLQYATNWNEDDAASANRYINLTRQLYSYMEPFVSKFPREAFLNYRDLDLGINHQGNESYIEASAYGIKYFLQNFNRLVEVKTEVDPSNFFRNEQSIPVLPHWKKIGN